MVGLVHIAEYFPELPSESLLLGGAEIKMWLAFH